MEGESWGIIAKFRSGRTAARTRDRVEGPAAIVWALSVARAERQAAATAVAHELAVFVWSINREVMRILRRSVVGGSEPLESRRAQPANSLTLQIGLNKDSQRSDQ